MASMDQFSPSDDYRRALTLALLRQGTDTSPVKHWTQGAARLAQALVGSMWGNQLQQEQMDAMRWTPGSSPGGSADASPASVPPMGNKIADALATRPPYGQNMMPTDQGGSVPVPPSNPLGQADPQFRTQFADLRTELANRGVDINAPEAGSIGNVRTPQQQAGLYAQGRTAPGPVVTGTLNSNHLTGNAMDVVPLNTDAGTVGKMVTALTKTDPRFANMRSGATFSNLYDPLHVERTGTQVAGPADIPPNAQPTAQAGQPPMQVAQAQQDNLIKRMEADADAVLNDRSSSYAKMVKAYQTKQWIVQHRAEQALKYGPEAAAGEGRLAGAKAQAEADVKFSPKNVYGAASLAGAEAEAKNPAAIRLKGAPTFKEQQEFDLKEKSKGDLSNTVGAIASNLVALDNMGGVTNSTKGTMQNLSAYGSSTTMGQEMGRSIGSKAQALRDQVEQSRPALINAIRQATGMSAKAMDSNAELQFYMGQVGNPRVEFHAQLAALDKLDKTYGLGVGLKDKVRPEVYDRMQKAQAQLDSQYKVQSAGPTRGDIEAEMRKRKLLP